MQKPRLACFVRTLNGNGLRLEGLLYLLQPEIRLKFCVALLSIRTGLKIYIAVRCAARV